MAAVSLYPGEKRPLTAADIGCDHAKLSVYLIQSGLCDRVYASDINDGPVKKASQTLSVRTFCGRSLSQYITVTKSDGLSHLEGTSLDRIFILGMGGELIASILDNADFIKNKELAGKIGFILQPMTSEFELRRYLYENGFEIREERLLLDKGRIYSVMLCVYDGAERSASDAEYLLGTHNIQSKSQLFYQQLSRRIRITKAALSQLSSGGKTNPQLQKLLEELEELQK